MTPLVWYAIAVAMAAISTWRPAWAICLIIVGAPAYVLRTSGANIPTTALEAGMLGTLVGYTLKNIAMALRQGNIFREHWDNFRTSVPRSLTVFIIITILGWVIASSLSIEVRTSLGSLKAWLIEPLLLGLIVLQTARSDRDRSRYESALLIVLLWVSVAGLIQLIGFRNTVEDGRLSSVFSPVANYFSMFAAPLIVYAFGMFMLKRSRMLAGVAAVVGGIAMVLSYSYGGLLAVAAGAVVLALAFFSSTQRQRAVWLIAGLAVAVVVVQVPSGHFREKLNFTTRSSSVVRTQIWRTAIEIGKQHPVIGIGPGTFEKAYREVAPTLYRPPLEWLVAKPHNLYLTLWVETGVLGLIGILGAYWVFLRRTFRGRSASTLAAAASVAILVHGLLDTSLFKNDLAVLAVVIACLGLMSITPNPSAQTKN